MVVELNRNELFELESGGWLGAVVGGVIGSAVGYSTAGAVGTALVKFGVLAAGATIGAPATIAIVVVVGAATAYVGYRASNY